MMNHLVPTRVTDRNGKLTTVYRKPARNSLRSLIGLPAVERDAGRRQLISAINNEADILRSYKGYSFPTNRLPTYLLHGVLELLESDEADSMLVSSFEEACEGIKSRRHLIQWVEAMIAYAPTISSFSSHGKFSDGGTTGRHVSSLLQSRDTGDSAGMTEAQELALIELSHASSGTELAGSMFHRDTPYGLGIYYRNEALREFVRNHPDEEILQTAVMLVIDGKVRRIEELESVACGEVPGSLVEGAL